MTDGPRLPEGVAITALGVARARATESRRADRLFEDPLATAFLGDFAESASTPAQVFDVRAMLSEYVAIRTRFFDDMLLSASDTGISQIVMLAAGLDARAFRLHWPPGTCLFELDTPEMFVFKEHVLARAEAQPRCDRRIVGVDLREDWPTALLAHEFAPQRRSVWLMEGLLMYLTEPERDRLMARVGELSAEGSQLALEPPVWTVPPDLAPVVARGVLDQATIAQTLALRQVAASDLSVSEPSTWLRQWGWQAHLYDVAERFAAYGRGVAPAAAGSRRWLATATR